MAGQGGAGGVGGSVPTSGPPPAQGMDGVFAGGSDAGPAKDPSQALKGITDMTMEIDQILGMLATTFAEQGGQEIAQARSLIKQGAAKFLGSVGSAGASASTSPTSPGTNFPGGGFTSGK